MMLTSLVDLSILWLTHHVYIRNKLIKVAFQNRERGQIIKIVL